MNELVLGCGVAIVGLVFVQLLSLSWNTVQDFFLARDQREAAGELFRQRLAAANIYRAEVDKSRLAWNGYRKFEVQRRVEEAEGVASFYLVAHNRKPLASYAGGQYLTFRFNVPDHPKPVVRCYSLSDVLRDDTYRVTVKRVSPPSDHPDAPAGLISNYMHDHLKVGDIVDVSAPRGQFTLDLVSSRPAVLIGGGIGITPVLSMVHAAIEAGTSRELWVFCGARNRQEHPLKLELERLVAGRDNIQLVVAYSKPLKTDRLGVEYHHTGHVTVDLLKEHLPSSNFEFLMCGPPAMMNSLSRDLRAWNVPKSDIRTEAFGPATVSKAFGQPRKSESPKETKAPARVKVRFDRSNKDCSWTGSSENLLDFALEQGVEIESGCRAGNCGTCLIAVKSGRVDYLTEHGAEMEAGSCLTCIAAPAEDLILDA